MEEDGMIVNFVIPTKKDIAKTIASYNSNNNNTKNNKNNVQRNNNVKAKPQPKRDNNNNHTKNNSKSPSPTVQKNTQQSPKVNWKGESVTSPSPTSIITPIAPITQALAKSEKPITVQNNKSENIPKTTVQNNNNNKTENNTTQTNSKTIIQENKKTENKSIEKKNDKSSILKTFKPKPRKAKYDLTTIDPTLRPTTQTNEQLKEKEREIFEEESNDDNNSAFVNKPEKTVNNFEKNVNKNEKFVNNSKNVKEDTNIVNDINENFPTESKNSSSSSTTTTSIGFDSICERIRTSLNKELNITRPTKVQLRALPPILLKNDVLIKSKTGSGKTLAYLLPTLHLLQSFRSTRSDGAYVIIVTPTRELATQILEVATALLKTYPWLVTGAVMGGESKQKEKSRLRKGVTVLVATPGRLLDHLNNTQSFKVENVSWLILDEADRLLDLGFDVAIKEIISILDKRKKISIKRQNLLISATLDKGIQSLAQVSLTNPVYVNLQGDNDVTLFNKSEKSKNEEGDEEDDDNDDENGGGDGNEVDKEEGEDGIERFSVPKDLQQAYLVVPPKKRLVTLSSFLRLQSTHAGCKIIVFISTTDSVEFLHTLFSGISFYNSENENDDQKPAQKKNLFQNKSKYNIKNNNKNNKNKNNNNNNNEEDNNNNENEMEEEDDENEEKREELPLCFVKVYKLHGNMTQRDRTETFLAFKKAEAGILLCTDVAARGLDVPDVKWIVQYDPPSEVKEYVHRIGRTARLVGTGKSIIFVSSGPEEQYPFLLKKHGLELRKVNCESILDSLSLPYQIADIPARVMLQRRFEKEIDLHKPLLELAQNAFRSFVRGYATYPKHLKYIFHVKNLHLGHLAKSFGLQTPPSQLLSGKRTKYHKQQGNLENPSKKQKLTSDFQQITPLKKPKKVVSEYDSGF